MRMLLVIGTLLPMSSTAQFPWTHQYHSPDSLFANAPLLMETSNGDLVMMCSLSQLGGEKRLWFVRLAADGTTIADREYTSVNSAWVYALAELPDGRIVATGAYEGNSDALMMVLGPAGVIQSCRTLAPGLSQGNIQTILVDADSNLTASFWVSPFGYEAYVARIDPDGAGPVQATHISVDGENALFEVSTRCADGGVCHGGMLDASNYPLLLVRTGSDGAVHWAQRMDAGFFLRPYSIDELPDGGFMIAGTHYETSQTELFAMRTDSLGVPLWTKALVPLGGPGAIWSVAETRLIAPSLFLVAGGEPGGTAFCMVVDTAGVIQHSQRWSHEAITDLKIAQNGDVLMAASHPVPYWLGTSPVVLRTSSDLVAACPDTETSYTTNDITLTRTDNWATDTVIMPWLDITADFSSMPSTIYMVDLCGTSTNEEDISGDVPGPRVWPVPATDRVTVSATTTGRIVVIDALGRPLLFASMPGSGSIDLDISDIPAGHYQILLQNDSGVVARKLIKQ